MIITAPSLDPAQNVSGVSSVVQFIIEHNRECEYEHFQIGKTDGESGGALQRLLRTWKRYGEWRTQLAAYATPTATKTIVHYSFPLSAPSILRDPWFMHYALKRGMKMVVHVHGGLFLTAPRIPFILERILKWVFSWDVPFIVLSEGEKEILKNRFGAKRVEVLANCPEGPKGNGNGLRACSPEHLLERKNVNDNLNLNDNIKPAQRLELARTSERLLRACSPEHLLERKNSLNCSEGALEPFLKELVLGYLGRIEPNKGMGEMLSAMERLKSEGRKIRLRIAGKEEREGEYLPKFREALGEDFEYCGLVSGERKREFLESLDVFVMPTYFEGLPMSLLETMSYGAVPVVTEVGSIPTVVKDGENGLFVKVKDVDSICNALKKLDEDRVLLAQMSEKAQRTIQENFSAEKYVERLNEIYNSL